MMEMLNACSREHLVKVDYAEIFDAIDTLIHKSVLDITSILYQISLLSLDNNRILKDNALVTDWESEIAKLMVFLFAENPTGLRRDRVIDLLWPEATPARGNSLFTRLFTGCALLWAKILLFTAKGSISSTPISLAIMIPTDYRNALLRDIIREIWHIPLGQEALSIYHTPFWSPLT